MAVIEIGMGFHIKVGLPQEEKIEDKDLTYGEFQQLLIDTNHSGLFKTIEYTEKLLHERR